MTRRLSLPALATLVALVVGALSPAAAATNVPATPVGAGSLSGVPVSLTIENRGDMADRLVGASSPLAKRIEIQETLLIEGRRVMRALPDGIAIPAATTILLEPGRRHLMLVGLRSPLVQGETFPLTLSFLRAGPVPVTARVRRKVDAAGVPSIPSACAGDLCISLASAPPAPTG